MRAAVVHSFAAAPRYGTFDEPVVGADEVLVRVEACGLHPVVKALPSGTHYGSTGVLPFIPASMVWDGWRMAGACTSGRHVRRSAALRSTP